MKKALLAIGNPYRGDDGVSELVGRMVGESSDWHVFLGGDSPESEFPAIRRMSPDVLLLVDAVQGLEEGRVEFIEFSDELPREFGTHTLPVPLLIEYLNKFCGRVLFLGIGVDAEKTASICTELSLSATRAAEQALSMICRLNEMLDDADDGYAAIREKTDQKI